MIYPTLKYSLPHINPINPIYPINPINHISDNSVRPLMHIAPEYYLLSSIFLETLSTGILKKTLINKIWFIPVYLGYGLSFYIFPKALTKFSLSNAYTIWCGVGIILTTIIDALIYKEIVTIKKILGLLTIISGIKLIK
tara:strand:- start:1264 stop:1680 length:417 start_codon:yes stop_codon:yes gene_type:complete